MLSRRFRALGELPHSGQEAAGQRGEVVARVQDVSFAPLAFLLPHDIRAGREERPGALAVELQDDAAHAEHHPHCDHDVIWSKENQRILVEGQYLDFANFAELLTLTRVLTNGLKRHVSEHCAEGVVEQAFEDIQSDVREACVNVGVDSQNHSVSANDPTCGDVSLKHTHDFYCLSYEGSQNLCCTLCVVIVFWTVPFLQK